MIPQRPNSRDKPHSLPRYRRCREKFRAALYRLAVAEGDVRERLRGAYRYLRMLSEDEVPPALREKWSEILTDLTKLGPEVDRDGAVYQSAVEHTMSRIRNSTGRKIAERICALVREFD
jgi:hypothetical protein